MRTPAPNIGYTFKDTALLELALTHPSLSGKKNNQRLEFLGDAVLSSAVAHLLYERYPNEQEGELARRHAALVCTDALAEVARILDLGEVLKMASGEAGGGGRQNKTNLEDAMEALIGAIYLDGGYSAAEYFIRTHWQRLVETLTTPPKDAKTTLQEWAQAAGLPLPMYEIITTEGAAHEPVFTVEVTLQGYMPVTATAKSKRAAEQMAAAGLLQKLVN